MPNGYEHRKYGPHEYPNPDGTSDCKFGCGCWMGSTRSDGPLGIDPFGQCPNNPLDGKPRREGDTDYRDCVSQRIATLESRANTAERGLQEVSPEKKVLVTKLKAAENKVFGLEQTLQSITDLLPKLKKKR